MLKWIFGNNNKKTDLIVFTDNDNINKIVTTLPNDRGILKSLKYLYYADDTSLFDKDDPQ